MKKQTLLIIGLIGSILAIVGVFLPWRFFGELSTSGWEFRTEVISPYIALSGGIITLVGILAILKRKKPASYLLSIGGIIVIIGGVLGCFDVHARLGWALQIVVTRAIGYGIFMCIIGGILSLIDGMLSLRAKS